MKCNLTFGIYVKFLVMVKRIWQCGKLYCLAFLHFVFSTGLTIWRNVESDNGKLYCPLFDSSPGESARGLSIGTTPLSEDKCWTSIMTQLKYKSTNTQMNKYTNTTTQIQIHKCKYKWKIARDEGALCQYVKWVFSERFLSYFWVISECSLSLHRVCS